MVGSAGGDRKTGEANKQTRVTVRSAMSTVIDDQTCHRPSDAGRQLAWPAVTGSRH